MSERGTSSTVIRRVWLAKSSSARMRVASKIPVTGLPGRAEQLEARFGLDDQPAEKRFVETLHVLERVHHREARLLAKKHGRVAKRNVQVDEQRGIRAGVRERRSRH